MGKPNIKLNYWPSIPSEDNHQPDSSTTFVLHGFNVDDEGAGTTDVLIPYIINREKFHSVVDIDYGEFGLLDVIKYNRTVAQRLHYETSQLTCNSKRYAIGHSNAGAIILEAARQGAEFDAVLLINPALPRDTIFPACMGRVIIIHTEHDVPTAVARYCGFIPFLGVFVPSAWGDMGRVGAVWNAQSVDTYAALTYNVNMSAILGGHSHFFAKDIAAVWVTPCLNVLYGKPHTTPQLLQQIVLDYEANLSIL